MNRRFLVAGAALGVVFLAGAAVLRQQTRPAVASAAAPAVVEGASASRIRQERNFAPRTKGSPTAPITIFEVADFQCPACRVFWEETMPALEREYIATGKVRIVFVNLPLQEIHRNASAAHQLAMCAAEQGRFWAMHDRLFDQQAAWARLDDPSALFLAMADSVGLARDALDSCLDAERIKTLILEERDGVLRAGVKSTPSFIVQAGSDRGLFPGAAPIEAWRPILDSLLVASSGKE